MERVPEHAFPPAALGWSPADLRRSDADRSLLREVVLAVRPRWLRFQGKPISNALRSLVFR